MPVQACAAQQTPLACVAVGLRLLAALLLWASGLLGAAPAVAQVRSVLPAEASLARGGADDDDDVDDDLEDDDEDDDLTVIDEDDEFEDDDIEDPAAEEEEP